jgi:hypothetical protein
MTPERMWSTTAVKRIENPRWNAYRNITMYNDWETPWIIENTNPKCMQRMQGVIPYDEWSADSTDRLEQCSQQTKNSTCLSETIKDMDLCQIDGFKDFCFKLETTRRKLQYFNAYANEYVNEYDMLYTPSRFLPEEGVFAWDAIVRTYDTIKITSQCTDITTKIQNANVNIQQSSCPGQVMYDIASAFEDVYNIIIKIVNIYYYFGKMLLDMVMFLIAALLDQTPIMEAQKIEILASFNKIIRETASMWGLLSDLLLSWLSETSFFDKVLDLIEAICKAVKVVAGEILNFASFIISAINNIPGVSLDSVLLDMENKKIEIDKWDCIFTVALPEEDSEPKSLSASRCYQQKNGQTNMPTGLLGGTSSLFSCGPSSVCMIDSVSTEALVRCVNCEGNYGEYGCDMMLKMCVCGIKERESTSCITNDECTKTTSFCEMKASAISNSPGTGKCEEAGTSFCYRKSTDTTGQGVCTTIMNLQFDDMKTCDSTIVRDSDLCVASDQSNDIYLQSDTYVMDCGSSDNLCKTVVLNGISSKKIVRVNNRNTRRLLYMDNALSSSGLQLFLDINKNRIQNIPGDCGDVLRLCIPNSESISGLNTQCLYCSRLWWFWNLTLSQHSLNETVPDTVMMTFRDAVVQLAPNPNLLGYLMLKTPRALRMIAEDWLHDTVAFEQITNYIQHFCTFLEIMPNTLHHFIMFQMKNKESVRNTRLPSNMTELLPGNHPEAYTKNKSKLSYPSRLTNIRGTRTPDVNISFKSHIPKGKITVARPSRRLLQNTAMDSETTNRKIVLEDISFLKTFAAESIQKSNNNHFEKMKNPTPSCIISGGIAIDNILRDFAASMKGGGWQAKKKCSTDEIQLILESPLSCPIVEAPMLRVFDNVKIIIEYYTRIGKSGCLTNMAVSCLPPLKQKYTSVYSLLPSVPNSYHISNDTRHYTISKNSSDFGITQFISTLTAYVFGIVGYDIYKNTETFMSFITFTEIQNSTLYQERVKNNQFTLGRILIDITTCDLESANNCPVKRVPLILTLCTNFLFIFIFLLVFPTPSVMVFFLWTIGLTSGVWYMACNFNPLCFPRMPVCMGAGIYELTTQIFPLRLQLPKPLVNVELCSLDLIRNTNTASNITSSCLNQCNLDEIGITDIFSIVSAVESSIRADRAIFCEYIGFQLHDIIGIDPFSIHIQHFDTVFSNTHALDLQKSVYICIVINIHQVAALFLLFRIALPLIFFCTTAIFRLISSVSYDMWRFNLSINSNDEQETDLQPQTSDPGIDVSPTTVM